MTSNLMRFGSIMVTLFLFGLLDVYILLWLCVDVCILLLGSNINLMRKQMSVIDFTHLSQLMT